MLNFYINHLLWIQRPFQPNPATLGRLVGAWSLKENEDAIKEEDLVLQPKLADIKNVRSIIEDLDNHLQH